MEERLITITFIAKFGDNDHRGNRYLDGTDIRSHVDKINEDNGSGRPYNVYAEIGSHVVSGRLKEIKIENPEES